MLTLFHRKTHSYWFHRGLTQKHFMQIFSFEQNQWKIVLPNWKKARSSSHLLTFFLIVNFKIINFQNNPLDVLPQEFNWQFFAWRGVLLKQKNHFCSSLWWTNCRRCFFDIHLCSNLFLPTMMAWIFPRRFRWTAFKFWRTMTLKTMTVLFLSHSLAFGKRQKRLKNFFQHLEYQPQFSSALIFLLLLEEFQSTTLDAGGFFLKMSKFCSATVTWQAENA